MQIKNTAINIKLTAVFFIELNTLSLVRSGILNSFLWNIIITIPAAIKANETACDTLKPGNK